MFQINGTYDPTLRSWIVSSNQPDPDFPIQNMQFAILAYATLTI